MPGRRFLSIVLFLMCVTAPWLVPQPPRADRLERVCDCAKTPRQDSKADWSASKDHTWSM